MLVTDGANSTTSESFTQQNLHVAITPSATSQQSLLK